jgi:TPR repeat protein
MGDAHYLGTRERWISWPECVEMTSLRKIAASVTCVAVICGTAILWPVFKRRATERKFAQATRVRAEQGDANAQYSLAKMYANSQRVPQDYAEALRWLRKAVDQGNANAQYGLGVMYYEGHGVHKDNTEAVRWYRKAAEQGDAKAQYGLAYMYGRGQGVPQDSTEAIRWCRKAAEAGDAIAQYALGVRYAYGQGVPQDYAEAAGSYRKAADQGNAKAQYVLGLMYYRGQGVPQDYTEAFRLFREAGNQGDRAAQGILTVSYFKGQGVPRNYIEAIHWFGKIAASCLAWEPNGPVARWITIGAILLALPLLVVPKRRWGRATWLPPALTSAVLAAAVAHELLLSTFTLARLARLLPVTIFRGYGHVLWISLLAGLSALFAIAAVQEAKRGSKPAGDRGEPPPPPEGSLVSPT